MARHRRTRTLQPTSEDFLALAQDFRREAELDPEYRAQNLTEAADYYSLAGDDATAEELFRAAMDDGGFVAGSLHGYYADFLFKVGRGEEALALIETARKSRPEDLDVFVQIVEILGEYGHHREAAAWATRGLVLLFGSLADITADDLDEEQYGAMLVAARRAARQAQGLAADHLDDLETPFRR